MLELLRQSEIKVTRTIGYSSHRGRDSSLEYEPLTESERVIFGKILRCVAIRDSTYLNEALTHPSTKNQPNYQRLEFLGDALLREILLLTILERYPFLDKKGDIEEKMGFLVSASTQASIARKLKLLKYIWSETSITESILSDALEALIATIYLESNTLLSVNDCIIAWYKDTLSKCFKGTVSESESSSSGLSAKEQKSSSIIDMSASIPIDKKFSEVTQKTYTAKSKSSLFQPSIAKERKIESKGEAVIFKK